MDRLLHVNGHVAAHLLVIHRSYCNVSWSVAMWVNMWAYLIIKVLLGWRRVNRKVGTMNLFLLFTLLSSRGLRTPSLKPAQGFVSLLRAGFVSVCGAERESPPSLCLDEAAQGWDRWRSPPSLVEAQSGYCWQRPMCVDEKALLHGGLCCSLM